MFTWIPIYEELATKIAGMENRQAELIAMLKDMASKDIFSIKLQDYGTKDKPEELSEIDPFTFFANFNRNLTPANRIEILTYLKSKLGLTSEVPSDFDGIPLVDNRNVWFFAYAKDRETADVPALWKIAIQAVSRPPEKLDPKTFDACVGGRIQQVGTAKLTMGLFWLRPREYLALDGKMRAHLESNGISVPDITSLSDYLAVVKAARALCDGDFARLSSAAYVAKAPPPPSKRYWAGGITWDNVRKDAEFISGNYWQHGYTVRDERSESVWSLFDQIKIGDELAMKGFGGRNDLKVYYVGEVTGVEPDKAMVRLRKLDRNLYHDKAPANGGKGTWFDTILEVASPNAISKVFGLEQPASALGPPFDSIFRDRAEAEWYFDEIYKSLKLLGIESPDDKRFALTLSAKNNYIGLVYGWWYVLSCHGPANRDPRFTVALGLAQSQALGLQAQGEFRARGNTEKVALYYIAEESGGGLKADVLEKYREGLPFIRSMFQQWESTNYRKNHQSVLGRMVFDQAERQRLLTSGIQTDDKELPPPPDRADVLNRILYGPPGTGKTFALRNEYMERFTERAAAISRDDFAAGLVSDLAWWQVIAMVMLDIKAGRVSAILDHPLMQARIRQANNRTPRAAVWAHLQMHTKRSCPEVAYAKRYEPLLFTKDKSSVWSIDEQLARDEVPDLVDTLQRYRDYSPGQGAVIKRYEFTTFHQSYSYEDFVEGIKPEMAGDDGDTLTYDVKPGIFRTIVQRALADPEHDYALIIDEISRGNVANIFGELITLIEDDKRKGAENELSAKLPYSRADFVVPGNLYIIGAMNTADRSVEALDTALRRRFSFHPIRPDPERIRQPVSLGVDLRRLLTTINARIERLLDKDHCIGHSYFMGVADKPEPLAALRDAFATKILPLLEEYFYGAPAKIGMVLGERFVIRKEVVAEWAAGDWGSDEFDDRPVYELRDPTALTEDDYRSIYA